MTAYVYETGFFSGKDDLPPLDPLKIIRGMDFETQFVNLSNAVNSKLNTSGPTFTGTLAGPTGAFSGNVSVGGNQTIVGTLAVTGGITGGTF